MTLTQPLHEAPSSCSPPRRPKGILKNRSASNTNAPPIALEERPDNPSRELSERDIVLVNTIHNAGPHRRSTSRGATNSRRQSGSALSGLGSDAGDTSPRLKWDEANLYLAEQEREAAGARMKIDEPKTPFAKQYDPAQDEMETTALDAEDLVVDEVEQKRLAKGRDSDIPGLELGEPELNIDPVHTPESEKRVIVDETMGDGEEDGAEHGLRHGEEAGNVSEEEKEKHKKFEEMRRRHYEMKNIKDLLGHPEQLDELEDDEDTEMPFVPRTSNGH